MRGCIPCVTQFKAVIKKFPDFLPQLYDAPVPDWYDEIIQKSLIAYFRNRIIGLCDVEEWMEMFKDKAYLLKPKFDLLWEAYKGDLLDFSTSKARTSSVFESENMPDTQTAFWIKNQPVERPAQDVDGKLTIVNPISADRYLKTREASIVDYAGSSGLSTQTNLDDINHFRDMLQGFAMDYVKSFETYFAGRY